MSLSWQAHPTAAERSSKRRRLRLDAGALAILNLFLVGIWLAAGAGYFWPVWSLLGCALALGLKHLRWPAPARERPAKPAASG